MRLGCVVGAAVLWVAWLVLAVVFWFHDWDVGSFGFGLKCDGFGFG
jgi:hypothetical protein